MQIGLRRNDVGKDFQLVGEHRRGGLVTGGFNGEKVHDEISPRLRNLFPLMLLTHPPGVRSISGLPAGACCNHHVKVLCQTVRTFFLSRSDGS